MLPKHSPQQVRQCHGMVALIVIVHATKTLISWTQNYNGV